jgi:hypothetical protein
MAASWHVLRYRLVWSKHVQERLRLLEFQAIAQGLTHSRGQKSPKHQTPFSIDLMFLAHMLQPECRDSTLPGVRKNEEEQAPTASDGDGVY